MINVKQLEAFDAIIRTGSTTRAAARLLKTQPQISRLLATLEEEVGMTLFRRDAKGLTPTPAALEYHITVSAALAQLTTAISYGRTMARNSGSPIRVLASPHLARNIVVDAIADCCAEEENFAAEIVFQSSAAGPANTAGGNWDIALTIGPIDYGSPQSDLIAKAPVCAVLPPDHRLSRFDKVGWSDLSGESIILVNSHTEIRKVLDGRLVPAEDPLRKRIVVPNSTLACMLAEKGVGVAITDTLEGSTMKGAVMKILAPSIQLPYYITIKPDACGADMLVASIRRAFASRGAAVIEGC